jgi:predicted transcriptional regulator
VDPLETVNKVAGKLASGRSPTFAEAHVVKALEEINFQENVGRLKLSKDLKLGEGEIRTLVKHLKNEGLINVSNSGISLSPDGKKLLSRLRTLVSEPLDIPSTPLTVGPFNVAVRVTGMQDSVKYGLEQRDAAIMAGAKGASTLIFTKNGLAMPGTKEDITKRNPSVLDSLSRLILKEGDVIIIGSADEKIRAELGAKTAALELLKAKAKNSFTTQSAKGKTYHARHTRKTSVTSDQQSVDLENL